MADRASFEKEHFDATLSLGSVAGGVRRSACCTPLSTTTQRQSLAICIWPQSSVPHRRPEQPAQPLSTENPLTWLDCPNEPPGNLARTQAMCHIFHHPTAKIGGKGRGRRPWVRPGQFKEEPGVLPKREVLPHITVTCPPNEKC